MHGSIIEIIGDAVVAARRAGLGHAEARDLSLSPGVARVPVDQLYDQAVRSRSA